MTKQNPRFGINQIVRTARTLPPVLAGQEVPSMAIPTGSQVVVLEVQPFANTYRYRVEQVGGYKFEVWAYEDDLVEPLDSLYQL